MNWTETTLGAIAPLSYGKSLPQAERKDGTVPVYGSGGLAGFHSEALIDGPACVIGRKGSVGRTYLAEGPSWPIDTTFYTHGSDAIDLDYLYFLLQVLPLQESSDSAVPGLNRDYAHSLNVRIPDKFLQRRIANTLKSLDHKIRINSELSETLEQIAQTIFKSWFIDFDPVHAKSRGEQPEGMDAETAALFPDSFEESELGMIPAGWAIKALGDCDLIIESGARPKGGVSAFTHGVPSIGAESINGIGVFDFSKTKFIPEDYFARLKRGLPKDFDVLLYKDGGKPGEFKPRVGMFGLGFPFERFAINEHIFLLRSKVLGQPFLYCLVSSNSTLDELRLRGIKAAIPGINQSDVLTLITSVPTSELLAKFDAAVQPIIEHILSLSLESKLIANLRDALLPRLISGELEIPDELLVE